MEFNISDMYVFSGLVLAVAAAIFWAVYRTDKVHFTCEKTPVPAEA